MARCPKCGTMNDGKLTRCRNCNAILPVKLDAVMEARAERVTVSKVNTTGLPCPRCGTMNPYSRFKCTQCNASLTQYKRQSFRDRIFVYLGTVFLLALLVAVLAKMAKVL